MFKQLMTILMWSIAIAHVLTDRVIAPYLLSIFSELTADVPATATPTLTVAVTEAPAPVAEPAVVKTLRPTRRRRSAFRAVA